MYVVYSGYGRGAFSDILGVLRNLLGSFENIKLTSCPPALGTFYTDREVDINFRR